MHHSRLRHLLGLLAVFALTTGGCSSPTGDPTAPALPNAGTGTVASAARGGPSGVRFDGRVATVDAVGQFFQLRDGTLIRVNAATAWKQSGSRLGSIATLAEAVASGAVVRAKGNGQAETGSAIVAERVDARSESGGGNGGGDGQPSARNFRGDATAADSLSGTMALSTGLLVSVDEATTWKRGPQRLVSLEQLATALFAGASVYVKGKGAETDAGTVAATALDVRLRSSAFGPFRGEVLVVEESGALILVEGSVIYSFEATRWKQGRRWLSSTAAIVAALAAGEKVRAAGKGTLTADGSFLAAVMRAKVEPDNDEPVGEDVAERR